MENSLDSSSQVFFWGGIVVAAALVFVCFFKRVAHILIISGMGEQGQVYPWGLLANLAKSTSSRPMRDAALKQ